MKWITDRAVHAKCVSYYLAYRCSGWKYVNTLEPIRQTCASLCRLRYEILLCKRMPLDRGSRWSQSQKVQTQNTVQNDRLSVSWNEIICVSFVIFPTRGGDNRGDTVHCKYLITRYEDGHRHRLLPTIGSRRTAETYEQAAIILSPGQSRVWSL